MSNWGFDTATNCQGEASCIADTKINGNTTTFVMRYYNVNDPSKNLTPSEASALASHSIRVGAVWENGYPTSVGYFTYDQGVSDGVTAFSYAANTMNQHEGTPVYFAVDFDATSSDQAAIQNYFSGVRQGYGDYIQDQIHKGLPATTYDIGVYGSYWVLEWCRSQGICTYFFQANPSGWSGGENANQYPYDNIWQRSGSSVCGIGLDIDEAWGNEGAWLG